MKKLLAAFAVAAMALTPMASFAGDEEAGVADTIYVDADGPGIWQESNNAPGLQSTPTPELAADTRLA